MPFGYNIPSNRITRIPRQRGFDAANLNRLNADWISSPTSIDAELRKSIAIVRERARDLIRNNDYAKHYITMLRTNIVGANGFKFQSNVKKLGANTARVQGRLKIELDDVANAAIEQKFQDWAGNKDLCSANGRHNLRGICQQLIRYAGRDGEFFVRLVRNKAVRYGLQLQVIDPTMIDENHNVKLNDKQFIRMGVEMDLYRRPLAYHLRKFDPQFEAYGALSFSRELIRVPAGSMLHGYDQEFENQTRGISWLVQSMTRLRMLGGYEEAAVTNARLSAAKGGFFEQNPDIVSTAYTGTEKDLSTGQISTTVEPGQLEILPAGYKFSPWTPEYPNQQHEMFVRSTARGFSSGLDVSYPTLASDPSDANYSSIRHSRLEEIENWMLLQEWFVDAFLRPVFNAWLEMAMVTGELNLPFSEIDRFNKPIFMGRRWGWVDPLKDAQAKREERLLKLSTLTESLAEQGKDIEEHFAELQWEQELADKYGIDISIPTPGSTNSMNSTDPPAEAPSAKAGSKNSKSLIDEANALINTNGHH